MPDPGIIGEAHHLLDEQLAAVIRRVRLPRDHYLYRPFRVEQQLGEPGRVAQHQGQPLVGRNPPGEADRQHVVVQRVADPGQLGIGGAALAPGGVQPPPGLRHQPAAQDAADRPDPLGRRGRDEVPWLPVLRQRGVSVAGRPGSGSGTGRGQIQDLGRDPGRGVHAVRHRADRHLRGVEPRPQAGEHLPADLAVQPAHAVDPLRQPHPHHGHVEHAGIAAGVRLRAECEDPIARQRRIFRWPAELALHHLPGEPVDAGRHRGVRGEHRAGPAGGERLVEAEPAGRVLADALQAKEAGVALVGMEDLRLRVPGDRAELPDRAHPADAEQELLAEAVIAAPAVQPVGDLAQRGLVPLHVGVEQQQRYPAHLREPDLR